MNASEPLCDNSGIPSRQGILNATQGDRNHVTAHQKHHRTLQPDGFNPGLAGCSETGLLPDRRIPDAQAEPKRAVRDYYRKHRYSFDDDPRIIRDGSDECIVLTPLPKDINNAETADEWFKAFEYIPIRYSAYDCTGQIFTGWYKIIYRNGRFYAYHSLKCDC